MVRTTPAKSRRRGNEGRCAMDDEPVADELTSWCVAVVLFYHHHFTARQPDKLGVFAELRAVIGGALESGLTLDAIAAGVEAEFYLRYERDTARRLHSEFVEAFGDLTDLGRSAA